MMSWLIDEFGEREDVQLAIDRNIHTFGWSGSITTYYEPYRRPLTALLRHKKAKVRRWARATLRRVENLLDEVRMREEERAAQWET